MSFRQGRRHIIVIQVHTGLHTQIPRHPKVKRETARSIVEYFIFDMKIPEDEVASALGVDPPLVTEARRQYYSRLAS